MGGIGESYAVARISDAIFPVLRHMLLHVLSLHVSAFGHRHHLAAFVPRGSMYVPNRIMMQGLQFCTLWARLDNALSCPNLLLLSHEQF